MKKLLILTAAFMVLQSLPVFAEDGDKPMGDHKRMEREIKGDTNGDGMISESEFLAKSKTRFSEIDSNGDGNIDREEAKKAHEKRRGAMKEKRAKMKERFKERRENRAEHDGDRDSE